MWYRESPDTSRWSPITHKRPSGTVTSKGSLEGRLPGYRYGSSSGTPLTVTRPWGSQQRTRSPPTAITRLMRSFSPAGGSSPMNTSTRFPYVSSGLAGFGSGWSGSHPPGSRKTITWPRSTGRPSLRSSLLTSTRSPTSSVLAIESEGM